MTTAGLKAALCTDPWFGACARELQDALLALGRIVHLPAGAPLFNRGELADGLCCVVAGLLRVGALQGDGTESLLGYLEPYQWFGEVSLIDGQPRTHDATAHGDTATVLLIPQTELRDWLNAHPAHWRDLARLACAKLRTTFGILEDNAHLPLEQRLAKRLWLAAHGHGARRHAPRRQLRVLQQHLALMLGVSRQTTNKALRRLEERGVLKLHYGTIELCDLAALGRLTTQG